MVRIFGFIVAFAGLAVAALWATGFLPGGSSRGAEAGPTPTQVLFSATDVGNVVSVSDALSAGASLSQTDAFGRTALMRAAAAGHDRVVEVLLDAGADLEARSLGGWSALMFAVHEAPSASTALLLLNAGADPHVTDPDGRRALELAEENPAVRGSGVGVRLRELTEWSEELAVLRNGDVFAEGWPSMYIVPIADATLSSRASHLPGAPRAYRNGTHEGFDFYDGTVSVEIAYGTPQRVVASGVVIRADHDYVELDVPGYEALIAEARGSMQTPEDVLDALRGRQVWVRHPGGFVSRYAHLSGIPENVAVGQRIAQGSVIGFTGNSGTEEAAEGTEAGPHPHVEIWQGDRVYLGQGMEPAEIYAIAAQVFGFDALPPFTDGGLVF